MRHWTTHLRRWVPGVALLLLVVGVVSGPAAGPYVATDPGVRMGAPGAGGPLDGLTARQLDFFTTGLEDFAEVEVVEDGLGPRMNLDSCAGCHAQPATGGSSPFVNPQVAFASKDGGTDYVPSFITLNGPVREVRFKRNPDGTPDGGVHNTATITGRDGADAGCDLKQPDFAAEALKDNLIFRIPTPVFGAGLIEAVPDAVILANQAAQGATKKALGIGGRPNRVRPGQISGGTNNNGNDGTIARFGWKAQNQSLLIFSAEAYNVEMGISNDGFMSEREGHPACQYAMVPNDTTDSVTDGNTTPGGFGAIEKFAFFQRFLAAPTPSATVPGGAGSIAKGRALFVKIGCAICHTPSLMTGNNQVAALRYKTVNLYSDLLVHQMGPGLADEVSQGQAKGDEFRSAPLWGLGQRIFFLHDGRTTDLMEAIRAHKSNGNWKYGPSEANAVVNNFNALSGREQQDVLNFLRSL